MAGKKLIRLSWVTAVWTLGLLVGCASAPPPERLQTYFNREAIVGVSSELPHVEHLLDAGIALIEDTGFEESAPSLSQEGRIALVEYLRRKLEARLPLRILRTIVPANGKTKEQVRASLLTSAREAGLEYLFLAVHASQERTSPAWLTIMRDSIDVPGERIRNFALVEMALLDVKTGEVLATARGRAIATLEQLTPPMATTLYPVVYPSLQDTRVFATLDTAEETLRVVAGEGASDAAVNRLH